MDEVQQPKARTAELTRLLNEWQSGQDEGLLGEIVPAVYEELHRLARGYMRKQPANHTLQATALINEAFCRVGNIKAELQNRDHFIGIVANIMRQILVDHARLRNSQKRGGGADKLSIDDVSVASEGVATDDVLVIDALLRSLEKKDPRKVQIAELIYFCGATHKQAADALDISESTLLRELNMLKSLLALQLKDSY